jgi:hypothetical protein
MYSCSCGNLSSEFIFCLSSLAEAMYIINKGLSYYVLVYHMTNVGQIM